METLINILKWCAPFLVLAIIGFAGFGVGKAVNIELPKPWGAILTLAWLFVFGFLESID